MELLIVLVMASIVLTLGVPSLQTLIQNNRLTADTNRFTTSMMLARSEAIKRNTPAGIAAQSGNWNNGWVVWVDADDDGVQDTGELVLRTVSGLNTSVTLSSDGAITVFRYAADGTLNTTDRLDVCDSSTTGETGRRLTLAATGRVSLDPDITCP